MKKILFLGLLTLACSLISKGQENPITTKLYWDSVSEGSFNIPQNGNYQQFYAVGDRVIFPVENGRTNPTSIGGLSNLQPLAVFNTALGKFEKTESNWSGDPINPMFLFQNSYNSKIFFVFDNKKIFRVNLTKDSLVYSQIFQGGIHKFYGYSEGESKIYFFGYKHIVVCDKEGKFEKEIEVDYTTGGATENDMYSVTEYQNKIYLGFENSGYGMGIVDTFTGKVTIDKSIPQHGGCHIGLINDSLYMATNSNEGGSFNSVLYKMRNGKWEKIIFGGYLPEKHGAKWYIPMDANGGTAKYANGKNLGVSLDGTYEFVPSNDSVIARVKPYELPIRDARQDTIDFWGGYSDRYKERHGLGSSPEIDYLLETANGIYGFGNNIVAKLNPHNISAGFSKKVTLPKVVIYPNPATEKISIMGIQPDTPVEILTTTGQSVLSVLSKGNIDISSLNPGLYIMNIHGFTPVKFMKN